MIISIALAVAAFAATLVALGYDPVDRTFRFPLRDVETGTFRMPEQPLQIFLAVAFVIMVAGITKSVVDIVLGDRAAADAARQWQRMRSLISSPEIIIVAEFPETRLRDLAAGYPDATRVLDERLALVRQTPIPPDPCEGLLIAQGGGAVSILGEILAGDGGLSAADFSMVMGFYRDGKDLAPFDQSGLDLFDMSMAANASGADVRLSFVPDREAFRLAVVGTGDALATDPDTVTSTADLPGTIIVLQPFTETNAYERAFVSGLAIRDRRSGALYGIDLAGIAPAPADSGWPVHSLVGRLGASHPPCMPETPPDAG